MRTPDSRFYCPQIDVGEFSLDENESSHAIRVCRATAGDILQLSDGNGRFADATIVKADPKACIVRIDSFETVSSDANIAAFLFILKAPAFSCNKKMGNLQPKERSGGAQECATIVA